jgi:signal transduction histidine kinase
MQSDSTFGKKLKYNQNNIEFNLTQLNFTNSDQNLFRYMLEGAETHWNTSKSNIIHYYALAPGDYRFKAKAINYQGSLSENQLNIDFTINPPFWFSWWFQSIILIVISSILFILFKYREKQIKKLNSLRLSIARDMHDDMGSNLSNIKMLSELELIKSNTNPKESFRKIAEKTNQVMQSMSEIVWSINPSNDTMDSIILKIQEFAIDVLETQGIELKFDIEHTVSQAKLDLEERRHFYLIFKELINNAAKYSKATEVVLIIYYRHKRLSVIFSDNGIGFNSLLVNSGNGLKNLQSRVKLLNSHINIQSDENGTKVQFDLLC